MEAERITMTEDSQWRLVALQWTGSAEPADNLQQIRALLATLPVTTRQQLVALPEGALCFAGPEGANLALQEPLGAGQWQQQLAMLAQEFRIYLLCGTFPTQSTEPHRFAASSLLFSPAGELVADYQKIHLFDAAISDNTGRYQESAQTLAGDKAVVVDLPGLKLGLAICYDVRFAGLFQHYAAAGCQLLTLPSAFTTVTGAAHWHTLLRARAIECQSYVLAPAQTGTHANGRQTYGHSLIIDPWGQVLADAGTTPGVIFADVDLAELAKLRQQMPIRQHNRFKSEFL
jgi:predicted amidohydrolase